MTNCIFCKIVSGELPCYKVYEDESYLAFLDIKPVNKGHTIIIPKKHSDNFLDSNIEESKGILSVLQKIGKAVLKATGAQGCNISTNNGSAAGQVIMHLHWHIVPRFEHDGLKLWPGGQYGEGVAEKLIGEIKSHLEEAVLK